MKRSTPPRLGDRSVRRSSRRHKLSLPDVLPSRAERKANGKARRDGLPCTEQGKWVPKERGDDLVHQLKAAVVGRRADLLPIRWGRMSKSPFAFYRGAAAVMAADLGPLPACGLAVQVCGDAHLLNMGAYAAPDGHLIFDLNDFDETCRGPFRVLRRAWSSAAAPPARRTPPAARRYAR